MLSNFEKNEIITWARNIKAVYSILLDVGFSESQALKIVIETMLKR